ncbi:uncharacterized protein LAESUDRAFT_225347 [Laetiporus sulphureus 93-53]|uniref:Secreted protein n=1 Tax=Laetiporus sulphureus 93-53 TaxID=1314785 RepID=A0A165DPI8_9APHY|nr:uncharacterized protein LAESUDRAFT_225347 [Laetiporus sulphureus 93-53]KZT05337.1 hypothetical protein LAESUDRAFT_225347 [Laetiporus sulphureus 93-53]
MHVILYLLWVTECLHCQPQSYAYSSRAVLSQECCTVLGGWVRSAEAGEPVTIQSKASYRVGAWRPTSTGWLNCAVRDHCGSVSAVQLPSMVDI